jgi:hypothetical protein
MKRSEIKKELSELRNSWSYMVVHNTGEGFHRGEVFTKIKLYERILSEGYEDDLSGTPQVERAAR